MTIASQGDYPCLIDAATNTANYMEQGGRARIPVTDAHLALVQSSPHWLRYDIALPETGPIDRERLLLLNRHIPGGAKICLSSRGGSRLRLETPQDSYDDTNVSGAGDKGEDNRGDGDSHTLRDLTTLRGALAYLDTQDKPAKPVDRRIAAANVPQLSEFCRGWPCLDREPGRWMVELDVIEAYSQAEINLMGDELVITVALCEWDELSPPSTGAITDLLVYACSTLRMCRAAIEVRDPYGMRCLLMANVSYADLDTDLPPALSALSVGVRGLHRELLALQNPEIAGCYLAMTSRQAGRV